MEPKDQELYDQLLGYLSAEGEIEEDAAAGIVLITEYSHRRLDPPLRLHLTPADFGRHLRDAAPDAASAYPDVPPIEAAWRLLIVHLDEGVDTAKPGETELVLTRYGVESRRPDLTPTPMSVEDRARHEDQQRYDRLLAHLADRGVVEEDLRNEMIVIRDLDGRSFAQPIRLHVEVECLAEYLEADDDVEARWERLLVHLDEVMSTATGGIRVELTASGLVAHRAE